jgi:hypothetical protein
LSEGEVVKVYALK